MRTASRYVLKLKPDLRWTAGLLATMSTLDVTSIRSLVTRIIAEEGAESALSAPEDFMPLVASTEVQVRRVVQEALKFARHSKRQQLTPFDVDKALRLLGAPPAYGAPSSRNPLAIPLAEAIASSSGHGHRKVGATVAAFSKSANQRISLEDLKQVDLPRVPLEPGLSAAWIAIRGAPPGQVTKKRKRNGSSSSLSSSAAGVLSAASSAAAAATGGMSAPSVVQPGLTHTLSREQQQLLTDLLGHASGANHGEQQRAFKTLRALSGMQPLVPYIVQHIAKEVNQNLRNLPVLFAMLRLSQSLLLNATVNLELYLDQIMPAIFSCLVGKRVCKFPSENHWGLRELAARIISLICMKFRAKYPALQTRILNTLCRALGTDKAKPMTSQFGALVGLTALGPLVVEQLILPQAAKYLSKLDTDTAALKRANEHARASKAKRRRAAVASSIGEAGSSASVAAAMDIEATETRKESKRAVREDEIHRCRRAMFDAIACFTRGNAGATAVQSPALEQALGGLRERYKDELGKALDASSISSLQEEAGDSLLPFTSSSGVGDMFL